MQTTTVNNSPHIVVRIIWFVFIGLWLSGVWTAIAWVLCVSIIGLPIGLIMLDKLPFVSTLRGAQGITQGDSTGGVSNQPTPQYPFIIRAIYFLVFGWWVSALWLSLSWAIASTYIGYPLSFWMINRVPAVLTLDRN